jgi:hypothetical protein
MGRIFETRKASMFARWNKMAKAFTRVSKDITIAVKAGGPNPESNPALRRAMQNARAVNMPKDKVEGAIKRASGADAATYETVMYEGYAPHGVPLLIETATDNIVRTVGNVRAYFNKFNGNLASNGSVSFMFNRMGVFRSSSSSTTGLRSSAKASGRRATNRWSCAAHSRTSVSSRRRSRRRACTPSPVSPSTSPPPPCRSTRRRRRTCSSSLIASSRTTTSSASSTTSCEEKNNGTARRGSTQCRWSTGLEARRVNLIFD